MMEPLRIYCFIFALTVPLLSKDSLGKGNRIRPREEIFFQGKTSMKRPFDLRDPFQMPLKKVDLQKTAENEKKGFFRPVSSLKDIKLDDINITGIILGKERCALILDEKEEGGLITLKEGMKIGKEGHTVKAILPGGIVLVEKIKNIYGQYEYFERLIPIHSSETNNRQSSFDVRSTLDENGRLDGLDNSFTSRSPSSNGDINGTSSRVPRTPSRQGLNDVVDIIRSNRELQSRLLKSE